LGDGYSGWWIPNFLETKTKKRMETGTIKNGAENKIKTLVINAIILMIIFFSNEWYAHRSPKHF
jgi:hypothetical protein